MAITISGDSPNLTSANLSSPTLSSPTITNAVVSSMASSVITAGTSQASTSGTSIDFTSIPSWVKRVTVLYNGVSTSGTSPFQIQIGSGSLTTSGYTSGSYSGITTSTTGFIQVSGITAASLFYGTTTICLIGSNTYIASGVMLRAADSVQTSGGSVVLSGALDRLRITCINGTDTFDAGSINILYE